MISNILYWLGGMCLFGSFVNLTLEGPILPFLIVGVIFILIGVAVKKITSQPRNKEKSEFVKQVNDYFNGKTDELPSQLRIATEPLENIQKKHSPETYRHYINLQDYPTDKNFHKDQPQRYTALVKCIQFIQTTYFRQNNELIDPFQLANLILDEIPAYRWNTSTQKIEAIILAYIAYYQHFIEDRIIQQMKEVVKNLLIGKLITYNIRKSFTSEFIAKFTSNEDTKNIPDIDTERIFFNALSPFDDCYQKKPIDASIELSIKDLINTMILSTEAIAFSEEEKKELSLVNKTIYHILDYAIYRSFIFYIIAKMYLTDDGALEFFFNLSIYLKEHFRAKGLHWDFLHKFFESRENSYFSVTAKYDSLEKAHNSLESYLQHFFKNDDAEDFFKEFNVIEETENILLRLTKVSHLNSVYEIVSKDTKKSFLNTMALYKQL